MTTTTTEDKRTHVHTHTRNTTLHDVVHAHVRPLRLDTKGDMVSGGKTKKKTKPKTKSKLLRKPSFLRKTKENNPQKQNQKTDETAESAERKSFCCEENVGVLKPDTHTFKANLELPEGNTRPSFTRKGSDLALISGFVNKSARFSSPLNLNKQSTRFRNNAS